MNIRKIHGQLTAYFMLPLIVFLGVMGICLILWQNQKAIETRHIRALSETAAENIKVLIEHDMQLRISSLNRIAKRWEAQGYPTYDDWYNDAINHVNDDSGYQAIGWVDQQYISRWVAPTMENNGFLGIDVRFERNRANAFAMAKNTQAVILSQPIDLFIKGRGFLIIAPIQMKTEFAGFIVGALRYKSMFGALFSHEVLSNFDFSISDNGENIFERHSPDSKMKKSWVATTSVALNNLQWNITVWPNSAALLHAHTALPNNIIIIGFILAVLAASATYYAQRNRHNLSLINATLESTTDGILSIKMDGSIVAYNQRLIEMWGNDAAANSFNTAKQALEFISSQLIDQSAFYQMIKESQDMPERLCKEELPLKDGRVFECYSQPQKMAGKIIGRVWSIRNISQRKQMEDQLIHQATHDTLTGLPNRVLLIDRLQQAMLQAKRTATMVAVLFFDLDRFKFINSSLGHDMGDKLLQAVAVRLQETIRESDTAARLGGDEFVVIVTSLLSEEDIIPIVQKCLRVVRELITIDGRDLNITASIGVSFYPKDGHEVLSLLKNADTAMYRAKQSGKNNFQFYTSEMNARAVERLELENDLRRALSRNEFSLNYQPVIDLKTNKVCGFETLLRWIHPKLGVIPPIDFIPLLEEIGMIGDVGNWVLHTACAQGKEWHDMGFSSLYVAVNLSSREIKQKELISNIDIVLEKTKFKPDCLELELTEGSIMENSDAIISTMSALKKRGISLVIDDFGIGYSSLSYLKEFPVDKLKIDKSFIHDISDNPEDVAIVMTIIAMGRSLKLKVLAEGVETEGQFIFLEMNQCDQVQGYYVAKPMNAAQCTQFMREDPRFKVVSGKSN